MEQRSMHDDLMDFNDDGPCTKCGFQPDSVPPTDIAVAVRSFARRFRGVLSPVDEIDAQRMQRVPDAGGWSATQHAGHVRDVFHAIDLRLQRIVRDDDPSIAETPHTPPAAESESINAAFAGLQANAEQLAATIERIAGKEWNRTGQRDGRPITALDLAREAVHEGSHHLRSAQEVIDQLRASG